MEAQQVIDKIMADARAEAEKITKEAAESRAAEQAGLDEQLAQFEQETKAMTHQAAEDEKSHLLSGARMEAAREYLAEKASLLDEIFTQVRQRVSELPDDEYRQLMTKLMIEAVETGDEQVVAARNDSRVDDRLIGEVNNALRERVKGNLTLAEDKHNLRGGFVLRRGRIRTNVSIDVLVDQARNDLIMELARDLFSQDADGGQPQ
jgi:V/A-type H+-transporting ATPase subunit E